MKRRRCENCNKSFVISARHPEQKYCSREECRKARKNCWQRRKLASDEDYRKNQADCQKRWVDKHPGYWKQYREKHPKSTQRNRDKQRDRNQINRGTLPSGSRLSSIAKMDAKHQQNPLISGYYKLIPVTNTPFVKIAPIIVRIDEVINFGASV